MALRRRESEGDRHRNTQRGLRETKREGDRDRDTEGGRERYR